MEKTRVIFFDIGQTLVTGSDQSARRLLGSRLHLSEKETKRVGRLIMTCPAQEPAQLLDPLRTVLPRRDPTELRQALEDVWMEQIQSVRLIDGAVPLLETLKAYGFKLGVISNIWHPFFLGFSETCPQILKLLDHMVLSYRVGCKKPSERLYRVAAQRAGEDAASCWMVGDSYELDVEPAMKAGLHTIWVLFRPERETTLLAQALRGEKPSPDWAVENLAEIFTFFQAKRP